MKVQVGDFKIGEEEKAAINEVLDKGKLSEGEKVLEFERLWAEFVGTKHSVVLSSGTTAIIAGLHALKFRYNIKNESKVITSPLTYVATSNAIIASRLEPSFVDLEENTLLISPERIKEQLETSKEGEYSVIVPVHLMGYPCDMGKINKIAKKHNLLVLEDSAQAHGSEIGTKKTGSMSSLGAFSFYIAHNIQAGELGALTTDDFELWRLVKKIKANGRLCDCPTCLRSQSKCPRLAAYKGEEDFDPRFMHDILGFNFKAMEFQAALGLTQLKKADWIIKKRQENVKYLNEGLKKFERFIQLPEFSKKVSYLAYPIVIKNGISRRELRTKLEAKGVETRPLFGCIPTQQPAYSFMKKQYEGKLPNAEHIGKNAFYIGCHQYLTQEDLDYVINSFKEILK